MEEKKALSLDMQGEKVVISVDSNKDGENVVTLTLSAKEALGELLGKGKKIDGAKVAAFEMSGTKLRLAVDTDQDGEVLLDVVVDLKEVFDEVVKIF